ncbi:MAG: alpha/beta fold hydrolase, partial [Chloroflexi bacterium]|nr:alpha/beta fold hydrolase [Chloroflexota bacterium]
GLQCVEAAAVFYQSDLKSDTPAHEAETIATARAFAEDCVRQMGQAESLPYLGTRQAVEDLEAFRQAMGDVKFWLYGESYGTQFAQTYTAAHPDHLAGLILDGTVDLTLSGPDYLKEQAQAFNDVLASVLKDCNAKQECAADAGGDALAVYDKLAARLARAPMTFTFPLPSGGKAVRSFALADLENAAANNVYAEGGRMLLQRALAAAARADLVPLARLAYDALSLDPETLAAIPDPTWSDAVYYAVECNDYEYFSGTAEDRAQAYLRAGDVVDASIPRLSSIFYADLPCPFWPAHADPRPAPLTADGIPTLVLGATADPATPVANGERVFHRLADGFLITTDGGAHVIFGRGDACPDEIVTAFLVEGKLPAQRETRCHGVIADDYVSLAPADARAFADPLDALASAETEITYLPEYYNWDGETTTSVGCPHGGALTFEAAGEDQFTLTSCAFSSGFVMTGRGTYNSDDDRFTLDVAVTGLADGKLNYAREGDGTMTVTGEYGGKEVSFTK